MTTLVTFNSSLPCICNVRVIPLLSMVETLENISTQNKYLRSMYGSMYWAIVRAGAMGAIAPFNFQKYLFAFVNVEENVVV